MDGDVRRGGRGSGQSHWVFASWYPRAAAANDRSGFVRYRVRLLNGLSGEVVEIGAGSGLNFAYYPAEVTRIIAVEPEPRLREKARAAAQGSENKAAAEGGTEAVVAVSRPRFRVIAGLAQDLPLPDGSINTAVISLALCSVPDQAAALTEIRRVLRPGGELRFLEHVRARGRVGSLVQRALDLTLWPLLGAGCHCARETERAIAAAGFEIKEAERFRFPRSRLALRPTAPHVVGAAIRPQ
jgi:SAM-dependent methyltransferase